MKKVLCKIITLVFIVIFASSFCGVLKFSGNFKISFSINEMYDYATIKKVNASKPKIAIIIDDFGYDRQGVEEMLSIPVPLTCAVMPGLPFSTEDAEKAHRLGHEVIVHMPMEAYGNLPDSWYGPIVIRNSDSEEKAKVTLQTAINSIPHSRGVNIHMGTAVSQNKKLMKAIMEQIKQNNMYFIDSKTIEGSVCPEVAREVKLDFAVRDLFLEFGGTNYDFARKRISEGITLAKTKGFAILIGHVGPVGTTNTAKAIKDSLKEFEENGIEIVKTSSLFNGPISEF